MYSGITIGRVLNGEILYTKILEVNLFAFAYRLFRRDFSPIDGTYCIINGHYKRYTVLCPSPLKILWSRVFHLYSSLILIGLLGNFWLKTWNDPS